MDVSHIKPEYTAVTRQALYLEQVAKNIIRITVLPDVMFLLYMKRNLPIAQMNSVIALLYVTSPFADKMPQIPDKLLYLDVDILFNRDITLLYDMDIEGYEYAAARDHYGKYLVYFNYINAGVLLLNMKEIRRTGLFEKARELIKTKKLPFADQSAIFRSTTRKKMLPQRFNDQKFLHKHTVVRHFSRRLFYLPYPHTANIKQWDVTKVHGFSL